VFLKTDRSIEQIDPNESSTVGNWVLYFQEFGGTPGRQNRVLLIGSLKLVAEPNPFADTI
jgi:hypothetical protein